MECVQQPLAKPNPSHYSNPNASQSLSPTSGASPSKAVWASSKWDSMMRIQKKGVLGNVHRNETWERPVLGRDRGEQ